MSVDRTLSLYGLIVVCLAVLAFTASGGLAAQETADNGTETANETTVSGDETCATDEPAQLSQSRLYAEDRTIDDESGAQVQGGVQLSPTAACPVVVNVTLSPGPGVALEGGSNVTTTEDGSVRTQFRLEPGSVGEIGPVTVTASGSGSTHVEGNVTYWPVGHPELSRSVSGMRVQFERAGSSVTTTERTTTGTGPFVTPTAVLAALLACLAGLRYGLDGDR